jgi:hypothetical protein
MAFPPHFNGSGELNVLFRKGAVAFKGVTTHFIRRTVQDSPGSVPSRSPRRESRLSTPTMNHLNQEPGSFRCSAF